MNAPGEDCGGSQASFDRFARALERDYAKGSEEYKAREALYNQRLHRVRSHNCRPGKRLWVAGVTSLMDRTDEELARLRGRKSVPGPEGDRTSAGSFQFTARAKGLGAQTPESFSWSHLQALQQDKVIDQGACGSCWASATTLMLEAHTEIYNQYRRLSLQQLVACVPNPEKCGGAGGCNGSTGELALDYVMNYGLSDATILPYTSGVARHVTCPIGMKPTDSYRPVPQPNASIALGNTGPAVSLGMVGWNRLPENDLHSLYLALYTQGPVAVSIVAGPAWNFYISGILDSCLREAPIVNHLVVAIGYGTDEQMGVNYWLVQNSWGTGWGEMGQARMIRQADDREAAHCGWDDKPEEGTGCVGGPPRVYVCGSCGILYDAVVSHFQGTTPLAQEMAARRQLFQKEI